MVQGTGVTHRAARQTRPTAQSPEALHSTQRPDEVPQTWPLALHSLSEMHRADASDGDVSAVNGVSVLRSTEASMLTEGVVLEHATNTMIITGNERRFICSLHHVAPHLEAHPPFSERRDDSVDVNANRGRR